MPRWCACSASPRSRRHQTSTYEGVRVRSRRPNGTRPPGTAFAHRRSAPARSPSAPRFRSIPCWKGCAMLPGLAPPSLLPPLPRPSPTPVDPHSAYGRGLLRLALARCWRQAALAQTRLAWARLHGRPTSLRLAREAVDRALREEWRLGRLLYGGSPRGGAPAEPRP